MTPFDTTAGIRRPGTVTAKCATETYMIEQRFDRVARMVTGPDGTFRSHVPLLDGAPVADPASAFDWCWLRLLRRPSIDAPRGVIRIVDLFAGCGQMSVGAAEAARAVGMKTELVLALDTDPTAATVFGRIFENADVRTTKVEQLLGPEIRRPPCKRESRLVEALGTIDLLLGGPPCQGHSNLNNHTRGDDRRNELALRMVRFAKLVRPRFVLMENVRGIERDRGRVFERVRNSLERLGYQTAQAVIKAELHGVPQTRHRIFLLAVRDGDAATILELPRVDPRSFSWACGDLHGMRRHSEFDAVPMISPTNLRRIKYLFDKKKFDLPDSQRPPCHQGGGHKYKSIYGRLRWNEPVQTITTGFRSMGQGRYVHPRSRRVITSHEAARLQFIPDFVSFEGLSASATATLIGNAVPPKLVYGIVLNLLLAPWQRVIR